MFICIRAITLAARCLNQSYHCHLSKYCVRLVSQYRRSNKFSILEDRKPLFYELQLIRHYAKSKDKKKDKGAAKVQFNENQLNEIVNVETLRNYFQKPIDILKEEFLKNLSVRTSGGTIENLIVNFESQDYTLQELGQVIRKNPSMIVVNISVFPQVIPTVIKTLQKSGMNLNPQQDGTTLYIPIPKVTKEHRETLAKNAKQLFIKCRDNIKDAQMKHIKELKKKGISEDTISQAEHQIIALADIYISEAQTIYNNKCNELLNK